MRRRFLQVHPLFGVFMRSDQRILRSERWTIFVTIVMTSIFVTGLFYDSSQDQSTENIQDDKNLYEILEDFSWDDLKIIIYSALITVPIPFILRYFFRRKHIDTDKNLLRRQRVAMLKRIAGWTLATVIMIWSAWSCIIFSLDFGHNRTSQWMISFSFAEVFDLLVKDNITTFLVVILLIMVSTIKARRKRAKVRTSTTTN